MEKEYDISEAMKCVYEKKEEMDEGGGYEHYSKTCENGNPFNSATCYSWSHFVGAINPYIISYSHYFIMWPLVCLES
jgi:hypothetical protein